MQELRTGAINVLVTKDFSRCHRDYTQMGNYLECVFPFLGVRYISINDGYDSDDYKGVTSGMDVVLRNIILRRTARTCPSRPPQRRSS